MKLSGRGRMNDGTFGTTNRILIERAALQGKTSSHLVFPNVMVSSASVRSLANHPRTLQSTTLNRSHLTIVVSLGSAWLSNSRRTLHLDLIYLRPAEPQGMSTDKRLRSLPACHLRRRR